MGLRNAWNIALAKYNEPRSEKVIGAAYLGSLGLALAAFTQAAPIAEFGLIPGVAAVAISNMKVRRESPSA